MRNYDYTDYIILKKKNSQHRNGIKFGKLGDLINNLNDYDFAQNVVSSLLINRRVFHIRVFLIVDCIRGTYLYNNGCIIYAKTALSKNRTKNITEDMIITANIQSGYQNIDFYIKNNLPKDLYELKYYFKKNGMNWNKFKKNLVKVFKTLVNNHKPLCNFHKTNLNYQQLKIKIPKNVHIFGPDILVEPDLSVKILEVNSAPDLSVKRVGQLEWGTKIKKHLIKYTTNRNFNNKYFLKLS